MSDPNPDPIRPTPADNPTDPPPTRPEKPPAKAQDVPAAGPHDAEALTDAGKTPGAGTLPEPGEVPRSTDASSG